MELNYSEIFNKQIIKSLSEYCKLNNIENVDGFIKKCFDTGFNIEKYGLLGKTLNDGEKDLKTGKVEEKHVIKEVIVEKRVEIPVEIIKEVVVEKIITITNDKELEENIFHLNEQIESERKIFSTKIEEMENNFHYELSNKDKELDELRRNLDIPVDDNKLKMLQQTVQNLTSEVRELKKKNEELEKQLLESPKKVGNIPAKFYGNSNLNDDLYK
jgi:predicted RNase H-like nuclease (RuvC/YqgF family)